MVTEMLSTYDSRQGNRRDVTKNLLARAGRADGEERRRLIDEVVLCHLWLAESIARRYSNRGIERDDLVQVASLGLVNAAQRFDPDIGEDFISFAVPTMTGEIKRHFRDHGWTVRPPRRIQELHTAVNAAATELAQELHATPTPDAIAERLDVDLEKVDEARASGECYAVASIDATLDDEAPLVDSLGHVESGFGRAEAVVALAPVCRDLPRRDQRLLYLRFFKGWTQREIAQELHTTQMQVSRLQAQIIHKMRRRLGIAEPVK